MIPELQQHLDSGDDPGLWDIAPEYILEVLEKTPNTLVEIGRCSHWLRPHQTRWTEAGGFASPTGYGGRAYSRSGLPLFDWSVMLRWTESGWIELARRHRMPDVRITIPSRTIRHPQAAIRTLWKVHSKKEMRMYGFRKFDDHWVCVARSENTERVAAEHA